MEYKNILIKLKRGNSESFENPTYFYHSSNGNLVQVIDSQKTSHYFPIHTISKIEVIKEQN